MAKHKKQQLAIIGLGGQSRSELIPAIYQLSDRCQITAICDINEDFIAETQKILRDPESVKIYRSYQDLFNDVAAGKLIIDGVVVSLPHFLYDDVASLALPLDIPIFKEKPFALNLDFAKKLSTLAMKEDVQVYTVTKRQFYSSYQMGLKLLQEGVIGKPYLYSARHFIPHGNLYEGWRSNAQAAGGGALMDMGYHLLDVILRYFGEVSQANLHWTNIGKPGYTYEVEDCAILHNWHPIGVQGVFQVAVLSGPKEESIEIRGTEGRMIVTKSDLTLYDVQGNQTAHHDLKSDGVDATADALEQFLNSDKSIWSQNISHNMNLMRVLDLAYKGRYQ